MQNTRSKKPQPKAEQTMPAADKNFETVRSITKKQVKKHDKQARRIREAEKTVECAIKEAEKVAKTAGIDISITVENKSKKSFKERFALWRKKRQEKHAERKAKREAKRAQHVHLHKSFKRSYYEDYARLTRTPGLMHHTAQVFKLIFTHKKIFFTFLLTMVVSGIILIGLMDNETLDTFKDSLDDTNQKLANGQLSDFGKAGLLLIGTITTGGLNQGMDESQKVFLFLIVLLTFLITAFFARQLMAGNKVKMRDGLYNGPTALISSLVVFFVLFIEAIPLMLMIITYSAAVSTEFLKTPFYALVYFIFAALLLTLSLYLLSGGIIALVAVSAPGLYPITALFTASDLIAGRRIKFLIRIIYLAFVLAICWIVVMMPVILLDDLFNSVWDWFTNVPLIAFFLFVMVIFSVIFATVYLYLYYRYLLDFEDDERLPAAEATKTSSKK